MTRRAPRPTPRRDLLIATALELFRREGYHATGIDRVLAAAGVAKMTLYKHFASKEELIVACLERQAELGRAEREAHLAQVRGGPREQLLAVVDWHAERACAGAFGGCPFHHAAAEYAAVDHPIHRAVQAAKRELGLRLEQLAAAAGLPDPRATAGSLAVVIEGALVLGALGVVPDLRLRARALAEQVLPPAPPTAP
jgi:AcrR family transcriptional regulator